MRFQTLYEGRWIFAILFSLAIVCSFFSVWLTLICLALIGYTFAFFRDPARPDPTDKNGVVAAADGTIVDIVEAEEPEVLGPARNGSAFFFPYSMSTRIARPLLGALFFGNITKGCAWMRVARSAPKRMKR